MTELNKDSKRPTENSHKEAQLGECASNRICFSFQLNQELICPINIESHLPTFIPSVLFSLMPRITYSETASKYSAFKSL